MAGENGFPRRKRAARGPTARDSETAPDRLDEASRPTTQESLDVARYVTDMAAQLEAMAIASHLDLLAYFLGMAKSESELFVRTNALGGGGADRPGEAVSASGDHSGKPSP
jgi:hypothetical protein